MQAEDEEERLNGPALAGYVPPDADMAPGDGPQAEEPDEFSLRGLRKKDDFVWVDLENHASVRKLKYPIELARCEADEVGGKVNCSWYDPVSWKAPAPEQTN